MCISYDIGVIDEVSDVCVPLSDTAASFLCSRRGGRKTGALFISNLVQKTGNHRKTNEVLNSTRAHTIIKHTMQTKAQSNVRKHSCPSVAQCFEFCFTSKLQTYPVRIISACPSSVLDESSAALASSTARPSWKMALIPWKKKQSTTQTALWNGRTLRNRVRNQDRDTEERVERSGICSASSGRRSLMSSSNTDWST